ncbi:hypothetical protein HOLleu_33485 [Holothuria leucospilota]|uniref:C2H2-type domain-containing protein n=1 Tax=Holothuria leucospilota TaxID=206669 RepID=A0A9Q0YNQ1_HOLLE|nr:hypothetical protein HOLleu_33485 [Holothuria leucospilota]
MDVDPAGKVTPKKKIGRPRTVTVSEAKRKRREDVKRYKRTSVGLSSAYEAWNELRKTGKWTHGELALHLLDVHSRCCLKPTCKVSVPRKETTEASVAVTNDSCDEVRQSEIETRFTDVKAPVANGSVNGKKYVTILPKPVKNQTGMSKPGYNTSSVSEDKTKTIDRHDHAEKECNQNYVSESESDAAPFSVHTVAVPQEETISKDHEEHEQAQEAKGREEDEDLGTSQGEVELRERTTVADVLTLGENLEQDETDLLNDKSGSDNEGLENDSDFGEEPSIEIIFDGDEDGYSSEEEEGLKEKRQRLDHQVTDLPFKRFDLAEVAKAEGVSDVGISRNRIRKLYWTELERAYQCRMCTFEDSSANSTCRHLLQEHPAIVGDLEEYLRERPALDSEPGSTLYDMVMEVPPPNDSVVENNKESESCDGIGEEMGSVEIPEGGSKSSDSVGGEPKDNPLDSMESVELLARWVKLQLSCQFCQKVIRCHLFTQNGNRIIHRCRLGNCVLSLCDICGKSFVNFRQHWLSTHSKPELRICPYCGEMKTARLLSIHIINCHTSKKDEYQCEVCKKGFRTKQSRNIHEIIHQKEKPFKCTYCQRGFTQATNMKHHMRQHTGEKPYQCNMCSESFAHNVSLKNHLKSKHGIDPWKMDPAGD